MMVIHRMNAMRDDKMDAKNRFWASGIWLLPVSAGAAAWVGYAVIFFRQLKSVYSGNEAVLSAREKGMLFLAAALPPLNAALIQNVRYRCFGETNLDPFSRSASGCSRDKRKAMEGRIPGEYLSSKPDGFTIGKKGRRYIRIPVDPRNILHTLVVGSPGSMKSTTLLNALIYNFNFAKKEEKMTVFAIDVKPELQRKSVIYDPERGDVKVIDPSSKSPVFYGWDVYYGLDKTSSDDEVEARADMIARSLISCREGSDNSIFYSTAQNLMIAFLIYGFFTGKGFLDSMLQLMSVPMQDLVASVLSDTEMCTAHPKLRLILQAYDSGEGSNEMLKDVEATMHEKLRIFGVSSVQYMLRDNPRKASPQDLTDGTSVFLSLPDSLLKQYAPLINLITQQVISYLGSIPEWERSEKDVPVIWLLIDEFGSIGHMDVEGALARFRSRKICIWLCVQGLSQLDDTYGQYGRRSIVTDCECNLIFSSKDDTANRFFSDISGQYMETRISTHHNGASSFSESRNISSEYRPVYEVSDFVQLRRDRKLICFVDGYHFYIDKCPYFQIRELRELSDRIRSENSRILNKEGGGA